jgi:hypothetical protein
MAAPANNKPIPRTEKKAAVPATASASPPIIAVNNFILIHISLFYFRNPTNIHYYVYKYNIVIKKEGKIYPLLFLSCLS